MDDRDLDRRPSPDFGTDEEGLAWRLFEKVIERPRVLLCLVLVAFLPALFVLPRLTKDTRSEAFLPKDHPSILAKDKTRDLFGLDDPVVLAVVAADGASVFTPTGLGLVDRLTTEMMSTPGVDPESVSSLATEMDVVSRPAAATSDGPGPAEVVVEPFFEDAPSDVSEAAAVRDRAMRSTLLQGRLVARDGSATLIIAEMLPGASEASVYKAALELASTASTGFEVHVAGEGATTGYLSKYIDQDAMRLNPVAALVIALILFLAYRTMRGVLLPQIVTAGALLAALGGMALTDTPFFLITNGMLVLLIGVAVADTVHVLGQYYEEVARDPDASQRILVLRSMCAMWRPILITSVTDFAGLFALAMTSFMPPMRAFGLYAGIGVMAALVLSLLVLPCVLILRPVQRSRAFGGRSQARDDFAGAVLRKMGGWVARAPRVVLLVSGVVFGTALFQVPRLSFDDETIEYFDHDEPIYRADRSINERFDGTHSIDVLIDTGEAEGVLDAELLARVERLTQHLQARPEIRGTTSIVDVVRQVSATLDEVDDAAAHPLPQDDDRVAQSVLVYLLGAGGDGLEGLADAELRWLLVRAHLGQSRYTQTREAVQDVESYVAKEFSDLAVTLSGNVELDYRWVGTLRSSHLKSLFFASIAVLIVASLSFGSLRLGALAVLPVVLAVGLVYAFMAVRGIWLSVGTTMFAAISLGTAIDFSIHTLDRFLEEHDRGRDMAAVLPEVFATTGRALLFNALALVLGFLTLAVSEVPSLRQFGTLVALSALASFFASLTLLPSSVLLFPSVLNRRRSAQRGQSLDENQRPRKPVVALEQATLDR